MKPAILIVLALLSFAVSPPSRAQGGPPPAAPAEAPAAPPPGGVILTQPGGAPAEAGQAAPSGSAASARPTLIPTPGDPMDVNEVTLPGKPAAMIAGTGSWDEGFATLKGAFAKIEDALKQEGIAPAGRPVTVFLETDDTSFRYQAMVPIAAIPEGRATLTPEIRFGRIPEGKAYRFVHKAPYDDIDTTYETITAYLDAKGILAKDVFIEEYVTDLTDASEEIEINVFVQPR